MLKALYDYAHSHNLVLPVGYANKSLKAYVMLSSESRDYAEIRLCDGEQVSCPDVGSMAQGPSKSNVIVEKSSVIFPSEENAKSRFYADALRSLGGLEPDALVCAERISDPDTSALIRKKLSDARIKDSDRICFAVDDRRLTDSPQLLPWWKGFREELLRGKTEKQRKDKVPCLITGELTEPVETTPSAKGLYTVGGHGSGDSLICFDKAAFCSYGLKKAANAPVSPEAITAVVAALEDLIARAPYLTGMKLLHWYDRDIPEEWNPLKDPNLFGDSEDEENGEEDSTAISEETEETDEEARARALAREADAVASADRLVRSAEAGTHEALTDAIYHILLLSGATGRIVVRRYELGRYEDLRRNLDRWNGEIALTNAAGTGGCKPIRLRGRLIRLLKHQKSNKDISKRLSAELSGIAPAILMAILGGGRFPDAIAVRALAYIRSSLLASDTDDNGRSRRQPLDGWAHQWLKAWLIRNVEGDKVMLKESYNPEHPEPAYHCGALMAVYAALQGAALGNVNASVAQRYYASCIQTPALVLGRLSQLAVHHLNKIGSRWLAAYYSGLLERVSTAVGASIPATLGLEKQSYFALGYYQMSAAISAERREHLKKNEEE